MAEKNMDAMAGMSDMTETEECSECSGACQHCRHKSTPRDEELQRQMQNRLSRIIGQRGGIKKMLDENRYCGDVLTQIAAAESALQALGYMVLRDHMASCVVEQIRGGNNAIVDETVELMKKLK